MARCFLNNLNRTSQPGGTDSPKGYFITRDIPIQNIYRNDMNDYSLEDIRQLADSIAVQGLLSSLAVVHDPEPGGKEYRLISGERRWLALQLLVSEGNEAFSKATCQVLQKGSKNQECVALILANTQRNKTPADRVFEYETLKRTLEQMRASGETLMGADLSKGRIRDHIGRLLGECDGTLAALEKISNGLTPEMREKLDAGEMNFTAAKQAAALPEEVQKAILLNAEKTGEAITPKALKAVQKKEREPVQELQQEIVEQSTVSHYDTETKKQACKTTEEPTNKNLFAFGAIERSVKKCKELGEISSEEYAAAQDMLDLIREML